MKDVGSPLVESIMTHYASVCRPRHTTEYAAERMLEHDCGALPVLEGKRVIGIITDRDISCRVVALRRSPATTTVADIMTSPVVTVSPHTTIEECCRLMAENKIRRLPVIDSSGFCCGMVSLGDIGYRAPGYADWVFKEMSKRRCLEEPQEALVE